MTGFIATIADCLRRKPTFKAMQRSTEYLFYNLRDGGDRLSDNGDWMSELVQ